MIKIIGITGDPKVREQFNLRDPHQEVQGDQDPHPERRIKFMKF